MFLCIVRNARQNKAKGNFKMKVFFYCKEDWNAFVNGKGVIVSPKELKGVSIEKLVSPIEIEDTNRETGQMIVRKKF